MKIEAIDDLTYRPEDALLDDDNLLADRVLRSLHRNRDGHLAVSANCHPRSVLPVHNMAVLFCYTQDDDAYILHEHYLHSFEPQTYKRWLAAVLEEAEALEKYSGENFYGVYGWSTAYVKITPLRNGDLFIKVDADGARGVRLSFSTRTSKQTTRNEKKRKVKRNGSNRN